MKVTVFTSNQPRHLAYIEKLSRASEIVYAVVETTTAFPGLVQDFYRKSGAMQEYFSRVREAEVSIFGIHKPLPVNVRVLPIKMGDLSSLTEAHLSSILNSNYHLVFGSSYIRGWLADALVARGAINIHMGVSPYYRGSSCNFWALWDRRPEFVGATVHLLSQGLDSGPMLFHVRPRFEGQDIFRWTMQAVEDVQVEIMERISNDTIRGMSPVYQDRSLELRYCRNVAFTDEVARKFLARSISADEVRAALVLNQPEGLLA